MTELRIFATVACLALGAFAVNRLRKMLAPLPNFTPVLLDPTDHPD